MRGRLVLGAALGLSLAAWLLFEGSLEDSGSHLEPDAVAPIDGASPAPTSPLSPRGPAAGTRSPSSVPAAGARVPVPQAAGASGTALTLKLEDTEGHSLELFEVSGLITQGSAERGLFDPSSFSFVQDWVHRFGPMRTDATGQLRLDLGPQLVEMRAQATRTFRLVLRARDASVEARFHLPRPEDEPGPLDLGTLRVNLSPVVLEGTVLGPGGLARPQAWVELHGLGAAQSEVPPKSAWAGALDAVATDDSGRFRLRSHQHASLFFAVATSDGTKAISEPLPGGTRKVVLTLRDLGGFSGSVAPPPGLGPTAWDILLQPSGLPAPAHADEAMEDPRSYRAIQAAGASAFGLRELEPGRYDLLVYSRAYDRLVLTVPALTIGSGYASQPRAIWLRPLEGFVRLGVHAFGPAGEPLAGASVWIRAPRYARVPPEPKQLAPDESSYFLTAGRAPEPAEWQRLATSETGEFDLPVPPGMLELRIDAPGHVSRRMSSTAAELNVTLEADAEAPVEDQPVTESRSRFDFGPR